MDEKGVILSGSGDIGNVAQVDGHGEFAVYCITRISLHLKGRGCCAVKMAVPAWPGGNE